MSDLPPGWEWTTVGEACDVVLGQSPPGSSYNEVGDGMPFFQGKTEFGHLYPVVAKWTTSPKKVADPNDVLLSVRAPVGPTNLAPWPCAIGRGLVALGETSAVGHKYLLWAIRASADLLAAKATGSTFTAVSGAQVRAHPLPLAPRREQERIVAAVEEHLSRLDAAERALLLAAARLEFLESRAVDEAFFSFVERVPIREIAEVRGGIQKQPKRRPKENKAPFLRVANVGHGRLALDEVHEVELFEGELDRYRLRPGDLLVVEGNGSPDQIGRSAVWRGEIPDCVHQNHLIRVRPGPSLDPEFLGLYWNASSTRQQLTSVASSTSGLYTLSTSKVKQVKVPVASLPEQRSTVARLATQLEQFFRLRAEIGTALKRNGGLSRSILAAAFSGRLVPQDADDEPASVLLDIIRTERAAATPAKRTRKAKTP